MIHLLTQLIRQHPEWLKTSHAALSFMKISTPASGAELGKGKVLLLVFEEGEIIPTLCVKTVRTYFAAGIIRRNYENLKLLEEGVRGSKFTQMFAGPLYLYDDREVVFSVETVCPGVRFSAEARGIELVMEKYIAWQSYLAQNTKKFQTLGQDIQLPILTQHGDMTPDNVLTSDKSIYLIDYDCAGEINLPGFDLFNFLSKTRSRPEILDSYYKQYFPRYFRSVGVHVKSYDILFPFYHEEESNRKAKKS